MSAPVGPYSPAVRVGDWVATSGQLGVAPGPSGTPALVEGGTGPELRQALANVAAVLAGEGLGLADAVKATVFLADMADFGLVNEIWTELVPAPRPARSAVQVAALPLGARVEVEVWAHAARGRSTRAEAAGRGPASLGRGRVQASSPPRGPTGDQAPWPNR